MEEMSLIFDYLQSGGWVSIPLIGLFLIISYTSTYRLSLLYGGRKISVRSLFQNSSLGQGSVQSEFLKALKGIDGQSIPKLREAINFLTLDFDQETKKYSDLLRTAVILAPLLGLLGTIIGMIETFASLSSGSLFSHSGGIAGGISQALITTQLGLVVAIPGIFLSRYIQRIETKTHSDFLQLGELFILQQKKEVLP